MKKYIPMIVAVVVVGAIGFFGGMKYGQAKSVSALDAQGGQAGARQFGAGRRGAGGAGGPGAGGFTAGSILSKDPGSITVQLTSGGSKIVFVSTSTTVMKFATGSVNDLVVGGQVSVTGSANADGSITAQAVQLRPNMRPVAGN
jgi:hypothetical protein